MEQHECLLSDQVGTNGHTTAATLSPGGQLSWGDRRLDIEKQVLGFSVDGFKIKIRAVVEAEAGAGICCCSGKSALIRKTFVLELLSSDSLRNWTQKLQEYLDSLGSFFLLFLVCDLIEDHNHNPCYFCCNLIGCKSISSPFDEICLFMFQFCVRGFRQAKATIYNCESLRREEISIGYFSK